jgi:hypothetical protein
MCDRYAFFDAQSWLTPRDDVEEVGDEEEEIFLGACSFSLSASDQYGTVERDGEGAEETPTDEGDERERGARGALARDAMHVTFAVSSTLSDPASIRARFLEVKTATPSTSSMSSSSKNRQVGKVGSTSEKGCTARARLECELDGRRYVISTRTCREVVASFESSPKDVDGRGANARYLSCIFPHVTLNVYSTSDDASWDRLQILARALRDPALATVANDDVDALRPRKKRRKVRHGHEGKVSTISRVRDEDIELDIQSAFEEQRSAAMALCDAADALADDADTDDVWAGLSAKLLRRGVRDVFVDNSRAYHAVPSSLEFELA